MVPDPINDGWNVYNIGAIQDYQNFPYGVMAITLRQITVVQTSMGHGNVIEGFGNCWLEFKHFLPGLVVGPGGFYSPQVLNVSDGNMPAAGGATFVFLQDDAFSG